jgi:CO dehydrogenase/acetyl-CoA synthase alpha subunit
MLFVVTILLTYSSQAFVLPFPRHAFVAPSSALYEASKQAADQDLSELVNEVLDEAAEAVLNDEIDETELAPGEVSDSIELFTRDQESEEQTIFDNEQMRLAIQLAQSG